MCVGLMWNERGSHRTNTIFTPVAGFGVCGDVRYSRQAAVPGNSRSKE